MNKIKKWLIILALIVLIGSIFTDKIIVFYIDLLWFEHLGFQSVLWTIIGSKFGLGILVALVFLALTYFPLKRIYDKTAHLPVLLSDEIRRDIVILELVGGNLKALLLFGPIVLAAMTGMVAAQKWDIVLQYLNAVPFNAQDPVFGQDYSFYLFDLPVILLVKSVLWEALVVVAIGAGLVFFFKRLVYLSPTGIVLLPDVRRTLSILAGCFMFMLAMEFYLERYLLLMQGNGVVTGIGYAQYHGRLPFLWFLSVLGILGSLFCFTIMIRQSAKKIFIGAAAFGLVYLAGNVYPNILEKFIVTPNELIKETPYIENTIAGTLKAYGLENTETNVLTGAESLSSEDIAQNKVTIDNIRLWDQEPLLDTLGQIQEIRTYYQFNSVDNDRYTIDGKYRQTLLSPRELRSSSLPNRTWINEHLTFTHGYGVSLSPVNQITPEGLPVLFIKDIPPRSSVDLKVDRPEIYFGELSNDHVFVNTGTKEFDYPEGEKNVYKNYEGGGGFQVNSFFRKIVLAMRFKTLKILFSNDIYNDSRVLMYRNIQERVLNITPFLRLDNDPYLVVTGNRLVWLYDAYTVSDKFPYSQMIPGFGNYVRNSVKIAIDAYEGSMEFYVVDPDDPIILTYRNIFPELFKDLSEMPEDLKQHIRYPSDLFSIQTFIYATYHMKTPQVFYNKEDQWEIPEIDGRVMQPYYTIMKLPGKDHEEYILMLPFTPQGKSNLSAWMVSRSDGENYGKLVAYTFPKQKLVYGPNQIVARINQEAEISRQISLWDQRGSKVIQGTLLVIPIEESLIYVRPLYLRADAGKIPELKRVIVGYEDSIAMERTLDEAIEKIFGSFIKGSPSQAPEPAAVADSKIPSSSAGKARIVLKESDYRKIKTYFGRVLAQQKKLDQSMADYKNEIEALGKALGEAKVTQ
ncbi:MAG: UPF0182 family protein [Nitrospinota bacterium]|nr:UPF0182 family protein [Nitrospinota bacterium]